MKKLIIKELEPIQNLIDQESLQKLEDYLINTNLSKSERVKLVDIIKNFEALNLVKAA